MIWKGFEDTIILAGHRGERFNAPENTITSFRRAIEIGVDMIETDVHMTADHEIVLMHDHQVDRTTDGTGKICDMTLEKFKSLNAAKDFERFPREAPPTLKEFLELCARQDRLLIDFELKEYPETGHESFAFECVEKTIDMIEQYGFADLCMLNSFSGRLLEYIDEKYPRRYQLHGFYPFQALGPTTRDPRAYLNWLCMLNLFYLPDGSAQSFNFHTPPRRYFDTVKEAGIDIGVGGNIASREEISQCIEMGARMITSDYPADTLACLRDMGLHA